MLLFSIGILTQQTFRGPRRTSNSTKILMHLLRSHLQLGGACTPHVLSSQSTGLWEFLLCCLDPHPRHHHNEFKECRDPGSSRGPSDLRSDALPTELSRQLEEHNRFNDLTRSLCNSQMILCGMFHHPSIWQQACNTLVFVLFGCSWGQVEALP